MAGKKLDIVKKGADLGDDSWNATRGVFSKETVEIGGPFIVGSVMFLIHGLEFRKASRKLFEALINPFIGQRKVKIGTSALGFLFTGAGVGLGVTYLVGHLSQLGMIGAVSAGTTALMPFLPVILPGLLAATYLTYLARKIYIFSQAKKAEQAAWDRYCAKYKSEVEPLLRSNKLGDHIAGKVVNELYFSWYKEAYENRIKQEKTLAFSIIEVLGSGFVVGGLIAGSAAIIGAASVATLGILPITLIAIGAGVGLISKAIEYFDDHAGPIKKAHDFYRKLRGLEPTPDVTPGRFTQPVRRAFRGLFKYFGIMSSGELKPAELEVPLSAPPVIPPVEEKKHGDDKLVSVPLTPVAASSTPAHLPSNVVMPQAVQQANDDAPPSPLSESKSSQVSIMTGLSGRGDVKRPPALEIEDDDNSSKIRHLFYKHRPDTPIPKREEIHLSPKGMSA